MLLATITRKFLAEFLSRSVSLVPSPRPNPMVGPITGEMSIAPMMTGIELTFKPTEAMMMAQARMMTFGPRKEMFFLMAAAAFDRSTSSSR